MVSFHYSRKQQQQQQQQTGMYGCPEGQQLSVHNIRQYAQRTDAWQLMPGIPLESTLPTSDEAPKTFITPLGPSASPDGNHGHPPVQLLQRWVPPVTPIPGAVVSQRLALVLGPQPVPRLELVAGVVAWRQQRGRTFDSECQLVQPAWLPQSACCLVPADSR